MSGLNHSGQQSYEHRRTGGKTWCESDRFIVSAFHNGRDNAIQNPLLAPTCSQFFMLRLGSILANDISRAMEEELTKRNSRPLIQRGGFERCRHMLQPGTSSVGSDLETRM